MSERVHGLAASLALTIVIAAAFGQIANAASPNPANPALAPGATPPPGVAATPPPQLIQIDRNSALILIRTTLIALQQANQTSNYSVLYGISSPGFQNTNSPERLSQIFANLRGKGFDLSGVVVLEPQLTIAPEVYENGVMRMAGFFPSVPLQVYFDMQFVPVQGVWKLLAIGVNVGSPISAPPIPEVRPAPSSSEAPRPAQPAQSVTESPRPAPTQSASGQAGAPAVEVGKPKPTPTPTARRKL